MTGPTSPAAGRAGASYFSRFNPIPALPSYTGPYKVGTVDVEIPVSELDSPAPAPWNAEAIHTVQFRVYYPTTPDAQGKKITWLPAPQRAHVAALVQFMGIAPVVAEALSFLPRHLHYAAIPVVKNASLLEPNTPNARWPTVVFSHGLAGNRTTYSHLAGSLASHGTVVFCPEHRDGSALISFIRDPAAQDAFFMRNTRQVVPFRQIPHTPNVTSWKGRNDQLLVRLWELGLVFEAIVGIDEKVAMKNLNTSTPASALEQFGGKLHVQDPGSITWAGHSFGAATIVQFLKSTYYADFPEVAAMKHPLFRPSANSRLRRQITEKSITILLDMWCLALVAPSSRALYNLPLPVYADVPTAPGGTALLAVESESFFKWEEQLHIKAKILSADPTLPVVSAASFERPSGIRLPEPNFFYVTQSAHLSQSDFGVLFPWVTGKFFGIKEPLQPLRLNMRALLQVLRSNGVPVAHTPSGDLIDGPYLDDPDAKEGGIARSDVGGTNDDTAILSRKKDTGIDNWKWIDIVGMGALTLIESFKDDTAAGTVAAKQLEKREEEMESEMELGLGATAATKDVTGST